MPANLPPQYGKAEEELRRATTPAERLEKLREMFRLLPKHKGTEKLQSDLKQKISRQRDELEHAKPGAKKSGRSFRVQHEGAGQVVLVGPPNAGKSALLAALTRAHPEVAPYPFTTRAPQPGMMAWQDVSVQLVDLPAVSAEFLEPWCVGVIRSADAALLFLDLADDDALDAVEATLQRLASLHTELVGTLPFDNEDDALRHVPTLLVANKLDAVDANDRLEMAREWFNGRFPIYPVSAAEGTDLQPLRSAIYERLGVLRVYTKVPGRPVDRTNPYTLAHGSTVADLARTIHNDLEQSLKFARVWGRGGFEGQTVRRDYELNEGDVIELHS